MTSESKSRINSGVNIGVLISSISTLVLLAGGLIHMGRQFERLNTHYGNDWCLSEQEIWAAQLERENRALQLKVPDPRRIHNEVK